MKKIDLIFLFIYCSSILFSKNKSYAQTGFPNDVLPAYITPLTDFGQRAEWSLDGNRLFFLDKPGGDVWAVNIKTKKTNQISKPEYRPQGHGYYRVACLANGDLLLGCGAERHKLYFQILNKNLKSLPLIIENEELDEGPAVSRKNMKIAWTLPGQEQIYAGEIAYSNGQVKIINKKLVVDNKNVIVDGVKYEDIIETQNWRPNKEDELIFAQYTRGKGFFRSEVFGINLMTGKIINYSKAPDTYDEPEGIFPDGEYTLVESDKHRPTGRTSTIDIYKLRLDGSGTNFKRLTFFSDVNGFRSSNPVVSDDGKFIAFQSSGAKSAAGSGLGLYLFDITKFEKAENTANVKNNYLQRKDTK